MHLSICPSIHLFFSLSIYLSLCLSVRLSVYLSIDPSIHLSTYLPTDVSIYLLVYLSFWLSIDLSCSARLSPILDVPSLKTSMLCETSCTIALWNLENEGILQDFLIFWKLEAPKRRYFARLPSDFGMSRRIWSWRPLRVAVFGLHVFKRLPLPRKKCSWGRGNPAPATKNDVLKRWFSATQKPHAFRKFDVLELQHLEPRGENAAPAT